MANIGKFCQCGRQKKICIVIATYINMASSYTLSGRIGKVVASHAAVARSISLRCTDLCYARGAQGVLPMRVGGGSTVNSVLVDLYWSQYSHQSIGSTVSDAIVRSWLWLTATRSSPVGCFSTLLQVVDN